ncbi:unnamed protein product [Prunus armeniaca]|uniref:Ubiquitin-like domain-containing protein n=1 Tax=Prunus armeniaca TaxID=36596 RepID=A0A6J5Y1M7_PRUAR|nr:unnamed protein product [Prunus armeniaca]
MDEQGGAPRHLPGQESPSYYNNLQYEAAVTTAIYYGRMVVGGQVAVNDDNEVGDQDHGQGVAANGGEEVQFERVASMWTEEIIGNCYKFVVVRQGHKDEVIEVSKFGIVASIKDKIECLLGIRVSQQVLFFNGEYLHEDWRIIQSIEGIASNSRIQLFVLEPSAVIPTSAPIEGLAPPSRYSLRPRPRR